MMSISLQDYALIAITENLLNANSRGSIRSLERGSDRLWSSEQLKDREYQ